jgi:hypothetical protein
VRRRGHPLDAARSAAPPGVSHAAPRSGDDEAEETISTAAKLRQAPLP